jgi:hypothetical protein
MNKFMHLLPAIVMLQLLLVTTTLAQNAQEVSLNVSARARTDALSQTVLNSLSSLPEADTLIFINPQRILNEAVPKLMPEKQVAEMRSTLNEIKQNVGVDPSKVEYVVVALRFRKPSADLNFMAPEVMIVAGGDFSADSLLLLARMASGGKLRDEKYGTKTLSLMTIDPLVKQAEKNPILKSYSELGIISLNATTIAAGTPAYLKAAVDAEEGRGRISSESLNFLVRDPNALISVAGSPWNSFSKSFGLMGTEAAARTPRCETKLGDFYGAITMDATNFMLRGVTNADNPDTAKILTNLFSSLLQQAASSIPDKSAQSVLKTLSITPENDEVVLRADIPQQTVIDFIREQMKPKKQEEAAPAKTAEPTKKKRVVRRRRPMTKT